MILKAKSYNLKAGHAHFRVRAGFSLIEMMVVLTIFGIMTAVVLANFPAFRDKTALDLIAQEIATTIRQAQVYGIGTRAAGAGTSQSFSSYGIYLNPTNTPDFELDNKSFILYSDNGSTPNNYDIDDSLIEKFVIRGGAEISVLQGCIVDCVSPVPDLLTDLNILFQRPYPEANFGVTAYSYVKIVIKSTRTGDERTIEVWNTGQIVVKPI